MKEVTGETLEHVMRLAVGYMPSIALNVVVKLGVAEQLTDGPRTVDDIARAVGALPDNLYRVMRSLATVGVFSENNQGVFAQTPASDVLRRDHPMSIRGLVEFLPDPVHLHAYANLIETITRGIPAMEVSLGKPIFEAFEQDPEELKIFHAAMVNFTQICLPAILDAYDFGGIRTLVDVGGGHGSVIAGILQRYPSMHGILYDLDYVVASADPVLQSAGVLERCKKIPGNFFESVPSGGDAYIMKHIIHDWDDEKSIMILKHIGAALSNRRDGKVLLLEAVLPEGNEPHLAKWIDIEMMVGPGGRERTEAEFRQLFNRAGMRLTRITPSHSPLSVIEAALSI
jgi:hypothetical protein